MFDLEKELQPFVPDWDAPNPFRVLDPEGPEMAKYRIITLWGGRGSGKTTAVAGATAHVMSEYSMRVLAAREYQVSIKESSKKEIEDAIESLALGGFEITNMEIRNYETGSTCSFKGLWQNVRSLKSIAGINWVWIEEGQQLTKDTMEILFPSIRVHGNRIIITMNPEDEDDFAYQELIAKAGLPGYEDRLAVMVNFDDNPYFTESLESDRQNAIHRVLSAPNEDAKGQAEADYLHIWRGEPKRIVGAGILKRWVKREFDAPENVELYHGADWSNGGSDPTAGVRSFIAKDESGLPCLWVDYEVHEYNKTLDELPVMFDEIPSLNRKVERPSKWEITGDSSLPLAINKMEDSGFDIKPAIKAPGSVLNGIAFLNNFHRIYVHPRCVYVLDECKKYKWKQDAKSKRILPIPVDRDNHCIDGLRYSLEHIMVDPPAAFFDMSSDFADFQWDADDKVFVPIKKGPVNPWSL